MPSYASPPTAPDAADPDFVTLRDGSTALVHIAGLGDRGALTDFFGRLSPESRRRRFLSRVFPPPEQIASLCDGSNPRSALALVATRVQDGESRIIAAGSYHAKDGRTAEVAVAVATAFREWVWARCCWNGWLCWPCGKASRTSGRSPWPRIS